MERFDAGGWSHVCVCSHLHVFACLSWMYELLSLLLWAPIVTSQTKIVNLGITVHQWACGCSPLLPEGWSLSIAQDCWDGLFVAMHFIYLLSSIVLNFSCLQNSSVNFAGSCTQVTFQMQLAWCFRVTRILSTREVSSTRMKVDGLSSPRSLLIISK